MAKDYYNILGVDESATSADIKKAYRELAKKYHPDANRGNKSAENRFKEISEAYSVISDTDKRKKYDQMRKLGAFGSFGGGGGFNFDGNNFGKFWQSNTNNQKRGRGGFSIEDLLGASGFGLGDMFGEIFDRGSNVRRQKWSGKQKGESLQSELTIPFELAINGGRRIINVTREEKCSTCNGTGSKHGTKPQKCTTCHGNGTISMSQGFFSVNRPCPNCYGRGHIIKNVCSSCNGSGTIRKTKKLSVNIPPGIDSGTKLKLKGQGNPGIKGGETGDIFVKIQVSPHRFFKRKNNDIYCNIPIDIIKAIIGSKIRINTIYDKKIEIKIPPGTTNNKTFCLKGMGVIHKGIRGDQYVKVKLKKRDNLSMEERKIIENYEKSNR